MEKTNRARRPKPQAKRSGSGMPPAAALVVSALCGGAVTLVLLCVFAFVCEKVFLPLNLVRPLACIAAGIGAGVAGLMLAGLVKRSKLLCGVGCGLLFAASSALATVLAGGTPVLDGANLSFLLLLLAAGATGGAISALTGGSGAAVH